MHKNNIRWWQSLPAVYPEAFRPGGHVLELGAGPDRTVRALFPDSHYVTVDREAQPGVDVVAEIRHTTFPPASFDTLVSASMLEHDPTWRSSLLRIFPTLKSGGYAFLSFGADGNPPHDPTFTHLTRADFLAFLDDLGTMEVLDEGFEEDRYGPDIAGGYVCVLRQRDQAVPRLRVALCGNIALNATLLARFLRRETGIKADAFDYGTGPGLWHPAHEWADYDARQFANYDAIADWTQLVTRDGWQRAPWELMLGDNGRPPYYTSQIDCQQWQHLKPEYVPFDPTPQHRLSLEEWRGVVADTTILLRWTAIAQLAEDYDLVVLMGPEAANGVVLRRDQPYVTFEHSTMRYVPLRDKPDTRLLALAYQHADWNILTNADCVRAARELGLTKYSWIPHPVDTGKFCPAAQVPPLQAADEATLRPALLEALSRQCGHEVSLLLLAPARHTSEVRIGAKRNDRLIRALARYVREVEPAHPDRRMGVVMLRAGDGLGDSTALLMEEGLLDRVLWIPYLPKRQLAPLYRACDVVADQFCKTVGSFGTCTVEGMACARPVVTWFDPVVHAWCLPVMPPLVSACREQHIFEALRDLALSTQLREDLGAAGHTWVQTYHSPQLVAREHAALYERVLAGA